MRRESLYTDPLICHPKAGTTCCSQDPPRSSKSHLARAAGRLWFLPRELEELPTPLDRAWCPASRRAQQLLQGHKGLNPGEGTRSDLPPKRIFQFIPQHNMPGPVPASEPTPPVRMGHQGHPGVGHEVNPSAAGSPHLEEGHAGHPRESGSCSYLVGTKPAASPPGRAPRAGSRVPRGSPVPRQARRLQSQAAPASPSRKGTAGERGAASAAAAGSPRPLWGGVGREGARAS